MRALVTGCAGFIGSHLTEHLLGDGHDVVGVDCFNANYARADKLRNLERARAWDSFTFVPVDLAQGDLGDLVEGCDVVYHLAAEPGVRTSWGSGFDRYVRNNVTATQLLLEAVRAHPGARVVYGSSSSVYGQAATLPTREDVVPAPVSPYGVTKLAAEHLVGSYAASFGLDVLSLRFFSVFGPRQRPDMAFTAFCRAALAERPLAVLGDGGQTRDFTYVGDVVEALRQAATAPVPSGSVLNVGGGAPTTLGGAIDVLGDLVGRPLAVARGEQPPGDVRHTAADVGRARELLGYRPTTDLRAGLQQQWAWALSSADRP
ncbi:NAD-dependent epimerase/dehydratase family protein [Pseudokineococcus sp. 1T1Z-3]|uniref:NAD-dependent epimerase/dehydratase family protein n=1 Tax=Pseudokineococcus sp. 1T1Z-3 TaxID=3132745 RepID=UPI00309B0EC5